MIARVQTFWSKQTTANYPNPSSLEQSKDCDQFSPPPQWLIKPLANQWTDCFLSKLISWRIAVQNVLTKVQAYHIWYIIPKHPQALHHSGDPWALTQLHFCEFKCRLCTILNVFSLSWADTEWSGFFGGGACIAPICLTIKKKKIPKVVCNLLNWMVPFLYKTSESNVIRTVELAVFIFLQVNFK